MGFDLNAESVETGFSMENGLILIDGVNNEWTHVSLYQLNGKLLGQYSFRGNKEIELPKGMFVLKLKRKDELKTMLIPSIR